MAMNQVNPHQEIKEAIRDAIASDDDIHDKVKTITLNALTKQQLDKENITQVTDAVIKGITEGMSTQSEQAKQAFSHAASALDDALAIAVEASKLAIEEATSKVDAYSHHDLNAATTDLQEVEGMFFETLEKKAKDSGQLVADLIGDFVSHAKQSGTAIGKQTTEALEALKKLPPIGKETVISSAVATTVTLAQIGSGILLGIAESLHPSSHNK
jgi:hypothetical protein